jgi:hypothetical protein
MRKALVVGKQSGSPEISLERKPSDLRGETPTEVYIFENTAFTLLRRIL